RLGVPIRSGVIVREVDGAGLLVVPTPAGGVRLPERLRVEAVCRSDAWELPQPEPHVLVVAGGQHAASRPLERVDGCALAVGARLAAVHREEPQLVEVPATQSGEDRVPTARVDLTVSCGDLGER